MRIRPGQGAIRINGRELDEFFANVRQRNAVVAPLEQTGRRAELDVVIRVNGGGITGQAEDIRIQAEEVLRDKRLLNEIVAECTGQGYERVCEYTERDRYLNADEAKAFGIVDEVLKEEQKNKKEKKAGEKK